MLSIAVRAGPNGLTFIVNTKRCYRLKNRFFSNFFILFYFFPNIFFKYFFPRATPGTLACHKFMKNIAIKVITDFIVKEETVF